MHYHVSGKQDTDANGALLLGDESWWFCWSLGSLLCSSGSADIAHKIALAQVAFHTITKLWAVASGYSDTPGLQAYCVRSPGVVSAAL